MSDPLPLLLVDIDGVLNVYGVEECPTGYAEYELFPADDEPTRLAVIHGTWLRELGSAFDLVWASGWGVQAPDPPSRGDALHRRRQQRDYRSWRASRQRAWRPPKEPPHVASPPVSRILSPEGG